MEMNVTGFGKKKKKERSQTPNMVLTHVINQLLVWIKSRGAK